MFLSKWKRVSSFKFDVEVDLERAVQSKWSLTDDNFFRVADMIQLFLLMSYVYMTLGGQIEYRKI